MFGQKITCIMTNAIYLPIKALHCTYLYKYFTLTFYYITEVPSAPVGPLKISDINKTKAKLSWQPSEKDGGSPITGYIIEKCEGWKSTYIEAGKVKPNTTAFEMTGLTDGQEYYVQVKAVNNIGQSKPLEADMSFKAKSPYSKQFINLYFLLAERLIGRVARYSRTQV